MNIFKIVSTTFIMLMSLSSLIQAQTTTRGFNYTGPNNCHPFKTNYDKFADKWYSAHGSANHYNSGTAQYGRFESSSNGTDGVVTEQMAFSVTDIYTLSMVATNSYFVNTPTIPYYPQSHVSLFLSNFITVDTIYPGPTASCTAGSSGVFSNDYEFTLIPEANYTTDQYITYNFKSVKPSYTFTNSRIYLQSKSLAPVSHVEKITIVKTPIQFEFENNSSYHFPSSINVNFTGSFLIRVTDVQAAHPNVENLTVANYSYVVEGGSFTQTQPGSQTLRIYPNCGTTAVKVKARVNFTDGTFKEIVHTVPRFHPVGAISIGAFPETEYCIMSGAEGMNLTISGLTPDDMWIYGLSVIWHSAPGINPVSPVSLIDETIPRNNGNLFSTGLKQSFSVGTKGQYWITADIVLNCLNNPIVIGSTPPILIKVMDDVPEFTISSPVILCGYNAPQCYPYDPNTTITNIINNDSKLLVNTNSSHQICFGNIHNSMRARIVTLVAANECGTSNTNIDVRINYPQYCPSMPAVYRVVDQSNGYVVVEALLKQEVLDDKTLDLLEDDNVTKQLKVIDIQGRELYQASFNNSYHIINIQDFPVGLLLISIQSKDTITTVKYMKH